MPNISTTVYLNDEDYQKYLEQKEEILKLMRDTVRTKLGIKHPTDNRASNPKRTPKE